MFAITTTDIIISAVALVLIIIASLVFFKIGISYRKKTAEAAIGGAEQ